MWMLNNGNLDSSKNNQQQDLGVGSFAASPVAMMSRNEMALLALGEATQRRALVESLIAASLMPPISSPQGVSSPPLYYSRSASSAHNSFPLSSTQALQLLQLQAASSAPILTHKQQASAPPSASLPQDSLRLALFLQKQAREAANAAALSNRLSIGPMPCRTAIDGIAPTTMNIPAPLPPMQQPSSGCGSSSTVSSASNSNSNNDALSKDKARLNEDFGVDPLHRSKQSFPEKIYLMLEQVERDGKEDTVSFVNNGKAFLIHKPRLFESDIMPLFFSSRRMSSFQRQLNIYHFTRINDGPWRGAYQHEHFVRGKKELLTKIKRPEHHLPNSNKKSLISK